MGDESKSNGYSMTVAGVAYYPQVTTFTFASNRWKFCPHCGRKIEADWNNCAGCGVAVGVIGAQGWYNSYYPISCPSGPTWRNPLEVSW